MIIKPINLREANDFVHRYHRHHRAVVGAKFALGLYDKLNLVGIAICGRPVSRRLDDGLTIEVTRLCVKDGVKNACSKLYAACSRVSREMGYKRIITYTLMSEPGTSLHASGWILEAENVGGKAWNSSGKIARTSDVKDLFGTIQKYPAELKRRWSKVLGKEAGEG